MSSEDELIEKARKRAKEKVDFYGHSGFLAVVNIIVFTSWVIYD